MKRRTSALSDGLPYYPSAPIYTFSFWNSEHGHGGHQWTVESALVSKSREQSTAFTNNCDVLFQPQNWPVISDPGPSTSFIVSGFTRIRNPALTLCLTRDLRTRPLNIFYCIRLHSDQEPSAHSLSDLWSKTQAPQTSFIGSGLTLTCGHWALPNGDMCTVAVLVKRWKSGRALLIRW